MYNSDGSVSEAYKKVLLSWEKRDKEFKALDPFRQFMKFVGYNEKTGKFKDGMNAEEMREYLIDEGYDSVEIKGTTFDAPDGEGLGNQFLILKPENVRGKFSKGNPDDAASAGIMMSNGGDVDLDDIDIFDRTASMMNPLDPVPSMDRPMLSPAQLANIAGGFAPGAGAVEMSGGAPEYPDYDITTGEMITGPRSPSMAEDFDSGEYLSGALKGLGGLGDLAYAIPIVWAFSGRRIKDSQSGSKGLKGLSR